MCSKEASQRVAYRGRGHGRGGGAPGTVRASQKDGKAGATATYAAPRRAIILAFSFRACFIPGRGPPFF